MKRCTTCNTLRPLSEYHKRKSSRDGHSPGCKSCKKKYNANRNACSKVRENNAFNEAKNRAEKKGNPFTITQAWYNLRLAEGHCALTGMAFDRTKAATGKSAPFAPSLDQIIPNEGYTPENTRMVCWCVNTALSDWPDEVFDRMCAARVAFKHQQQVQANEIKEWEDTIKARRSA